MNDDKPVESSQQITCSGAELLVLLPKIRAEGKIVEQVRIVGAAEYVLSVRKLLPKPSE